MVIATTVTCHEGNGRGYCKSKVKYTENYLTLEESFISAQREAENPTNQYKKYAFSDKSNAQAQTDLFVGKSDLYTMLINEARFIPGDDSDLLPLEEIPWIDKSLINESASFHRKFFALVILSNTSNLMLGFAIKSNSAVLLRTGKLHDPELSFKRYLSTIERIGKFFAFPFDMKEAFKAFKTVRKMHAHASRKSLKSHPTPKSLKLHEPWKAELATAIRKDLEYFDTSSAPSKILTWDPPVPVSQFDMAITQFGFWGSMWLFPKAYGLKNRDKEMKGVIHVWAIFGRLLGIRDKYNICLRPDPSLYDKLFRNIIVESLKTMDETVVTLQSAFMEAFTKRVPFITYKSFLYLSFKEWKGFRGDNLWQLMTWKDKASLKLMEVGLWMICNDGSGVFRVLINFIVAIWLQFQFWLHLPRNSMLSMLWSTPKYMLHKMK